MKKNNLKRFMGILLALVMTLAYIIPVTTDVYAAEESASLAVDVVFVIDGSGSMLNSDPKKVSLEACKLFTDMLDYDSSRAGYILFSGEILASQPLTSLSKKTDRDTFKNKLGQINWKYQSSTDLSRGLTAAMNMLITSGSMTGERSPMIILLSDGRTDSLSSERKAVYDSEYAETLAFLKDNGVPVYTIALTASGDADEKTLSDIASQTNALYFSTKSAGDLSNILSQILANQLQTNLDYIDSFVGDGQSHDIVIPIPNDSIYQANIIIYSSNGVSDLHLKTPGKSEVVIPSDKVSISKSSSYQLVKIMTPEKGDWTLSLVGANKDNVTINLINNYDMIFELISQKSTYTNGDVGTFSLVCSNIDDASSVFNGAEGTLIIKNLETGEEKEYSLTWRDKEMSAQCQFNIAGSYSAYARVIGKNGSFDRTTSEIRFSVKPYPLALLDESGETSVTLFSPFILKLFNSSKINLSEIISSDNNSTLGVTPQPGGWESVCNVKFDEQSNDVIISAISSGKASISLQIADNFGQATFYTVNVNAVPGVFLFLGVVAVLLIIAAIVLFIIYKRMPLLSGTLILSLVLPDSMSAQTPPESEYNLGALSKKKGKVSLAEVISSNMTTSGQYMNVLGSVMGFVNNVKIEAANSDGSSLRLNLPATDKTGQVMSNGTMLEKPITQVVSINMPTTFSFSGFDGSYKFTITFKSGGFGGVGTIGNGFDNVSTDGPSFGNSSSFGDFGGGSNAGPGSFGSFAGNDSNSFGGSSSSGFGSFNGNDNNNGFGNF